MKKRERPSFTEKCIDLACDIHGLPFMVQIETTTFCNLKCPMCEHSYSSTKSRHMSYDTFRKIIKSFPSFFGRKPAIFNLTGTGENLMNREFLMMLRLCSGKSFFTFFTNNFTLLNNNVAKHFIGMKLDRIFVSFDGATKKTYEKMRVGAKFEEVTKNIRNLVYLKSRMKSRKPEIVIRFVPTKDNIHELPLLLELSRSLGIKQVDIPQLYVFKENRHLMLDNKTLELELTKSIRKAHETGVELKVKNQKTEPIFRCKRGKYSSYITVDGYVIPCCVLAQTSDFKKNYKTMYSFGNINDQSLRNIWNSGKYKAFRKALQKGIKPVICKQCPLYY